MDVFFRVFNQMAMMALLIIVGFVLRKIRIVPENTGATLSKLETFAICPALNFCTQVRYCTVENFSKYYSLILYGTIICVIAVVISYPLSKLFVRNYKENDVAAYQRNVYKYGLTFGNFGFIGDFLVLGVFGGEIFFTFKMFTLGMSIICTVWGLYVLIPKVGAKSGILTNLKAGLLAPPTLATFIGIICGLLGLGKFFSEDFYFIATKTISETSSETVFFVTKALEEAENVITPIITGKDFFIVKALDQAGSCMGPIAMMLAGTIIGGYDIKRLLGKKKVYVLTVLRLIVIPTIFVLILKLLGFTDNDILPFVLIAYATPLGMNSIVYPAAYGGDTESGASMVVVSSTLSIITIPVMYYLLIELL